MPPWNDLKCEKFTYMCSLINKDFLMGKKKKPGFKVSCFYLKKILKAKKAEIYFISIFQLIYTSQKQFLFIESNESSISMIIKFISCLMLVNLK